MRYVNILSALLFVFVIWVIPVKSDELNFPVTFDFVNMEISDILKAISVNYNINIVPDKDVSGRFSIRLSSVPLKTALNSFLNANGFKISEKDNIFSVSVIKENPYIKIIDNKLTLHSDNIPINEILRAVSVQTNLNIITSQPLDIKITAHINNVDPLSGLIKILNENGLSITQDNNYIKVYPVKPKYNIVYDDEKDYIAIEAVNTDIIEIINQLAKKTGKNIIIENSIKQDVTINLKNIEFERGMNTFLEIYGLKLLKYDNIYKIIKDNEGFKIPVTVRNNLVTADIRNGDLETALRQISAQTGYSLVLFKDIKSKINIQLKNTVLNEALEYLLKNTPLTYKFDDNQKILFIGSPAAEQNESDLFNKRITYKLNHYPVKQLLNILPKSFSAANMKYLSEINSVILTATEDVHNEFAKFLNIIDKQNDQKIFPLKYIEAKDFLSLLPSNLPDYSMKIIDEQNAVFVSGTPEMLEKMQNMINILDVKPAQIMIEILVAEISDEAKKELGLNALETKDNKISAIYAPLTGTSFTYNSVTRLSKEFSITLAALENRGLVEVKASPKIATKSGKQASIIVGREENFRITIPSANASVPLNQVEKIPSGIFLKIRPWSSINSDQINVDIHTEVSSSSGQASASELPTISKKTASTNLILKEGETVIIGGLKTIDKTNATEQIPLIGSIPVFGKFFSKSSKRNKETELTFFITPRIIKNIEGVDNNAE